MCGCHDVDHGSKAKTLPMSIAVLCNDAELLVVDHSHEDN